MGSSRTTVKGWVYPDFWRPLAGKTIMPIMFRPLQPDDIPVLVADARVWRLVRRTKRRGKANQETHDGR